MNLPISLAPSSYLNFVHSEQASTQAFVCTAFRAISLCSLAERIFSFRAKIKLQIPSLPNTFSQYSMRQWCMTKGLHIVDVECQVIVFRWLRSMGKYTKYIFIIGYSGDLWRYKYIDFSLYQWQNC
ncbi:hypothetical protein MFRU_012g00770 [Monilinia fructicola]|nr:hypothetical protein MFRU_012g00770 [Monilinia fructicola]